MSARPGVGGTVELVGLRREFDEVVAVDGIDLVIPGGEFFALLGPSGCGKTTTLRMIGGFERPTAGQILLDGVDMAQTPPHKRPVNTVFQSYALFPHLTVEENVAYGLRWRRDLSKQQRRDRVQRIIELVRLSEQAQRHPGQLSGGQQQRVALARALVLDPKVLLLDEPLGALDARLRTTLRQELIAVQREVGITFIFVTHDQTEALEMADRVAVMDRGLVVQCGTPREVYQEPRTAFVADFLGTANLLDVTCEGPPVDGEREVRIGDFVLTARCVGPASEPAGKVVIRPERIKLAARNGSISGANELPAMVDHLVYLGAITQVVLRLPHGPAVQALIANEDGGDAWSAGEPVTVTLPADALRLLEPDAAASEPEAQISIVASS